MTLSIGGRGRSPARYRDVPAADLPNAGFPAEKTMQDLTGHTYGRFVVIQRHGRNKQYNALWLCRCECGNTAVVIGSNLLRGNSISCGCYKSERVKQLKTIHGHSPKLTKRTPEYRAWAHARGRCHNATDKQHADYGGRGIAMCSRWSGSFLAFISDMGGKPTGHHSLDRTNNEGHYSCGRCSECDLMGWKQNCRWATPVEQARNRRERRKRA